MFFILDNKYKENQSIQDVTLPIIEIKSNLKLCFIIFKKNHTTKNTYRSYL